MKRIYLAAFSLILACTGAQAATVDWRQGSGNTGEHFTVASGAVLVPNGSALITLGLRAVERQVGTIVPSGNEYAVEPGESSPGRAWWNFDIYVGISGLWANEGFDLTEVAVLSGLSGLTLSISTVGGSSPAAAAFNLLDPTLRGAIDCHVIGCISGPPGNPDATSGLADPARFINASQNPVFAPWFTSFDVMQPAFYDFTLSAGGGVDGGPVSVSMRVTVGEPDIASVPEPGALGLLLGGGVLLVGMQRLRSIARRG